MESDVFNTSDLPTHLGYEEFFTIRTYEIDNRKKATPTAIIRLMQEAAMQNVLRLKLSVWDLEPQGIAWVLMRLHLTIHRLPQLGERIRIQTYPAGFEKFFTHRDSKIFDADGYLVAYSSSTWLLMDTHARRMARIPDLILAYQAQMPPESACLPRATDKLPKFEQACLRKTFEVNWHDLDFNLHLNNTLYIQWMLETIEDEILQQGYLHLLDVIFRAEAVWRDIVHAETDVVDYNTRLHRLIRASDGKELAAMRSIWTLPTTPTTHLA